MLAPSRKAIYAQRNYFFDSPDGRVSKFRRTLRIRFFDDDKAVLTIKVSAMKLLVSSGCSASMTPVVACCPMLQTRVGGRLAASVGIRLCCMTSGTPGDEGWCWQGNGGAPGCCLLLKGFQADLGLPSCGCAYPHMPLVTLRFASCLDPFQVEDDLPLDFAKKCLDEPSLLLTSDSQHIQQIKK
jgi:CYTH domain